MLNIAIFDPWQRSLSSRQQTAGKEPLQAGNLQSFAIGYFELPLVQTILLKRSTRSSEQDPIRAVFIFCKH